MSSNLPSSANASVSNDAPAMTPQQRAFSDTKSSGFSLYRRLSTGRAGLASFFGWEIVQLLLCNLSGIIGLGLRALAYPLFLRQCGRRPAIGRGVVVRVPSQITVGSGVIVDDYGCLDVRGDDGEIILGNRVSLGRFSTVAAKGGQISLGAGCNIGSYCRIATNSKVEFGESVLVGAYSYIGPGNHTEGSNSSESLSDQSQKAEALIEQPMDIRGGVKVGMYSWIGAHVTILDGVSIGQHAIIGAHSLVTKDVPDWGLAVGVPAKVIRIRNQR